MKNPKIFANKILTFFLGAFFMISSESCYLDVESPAPETEGEAAPSTYPNRPGENPPVHEEAAPVSSTVKIQTERELDLKSPSSSNKEAEGKGKNPASALLEEAARLDLNHASAVFLPQSPSKKIIARVAFEHRVVSGIVPSLRI